MGFFYLTSNNFFDKFFGHSAHTIPLKKYRKVSPLKYLRKWNVDAVRQQWWVNTKIQITFAIRILVLTHHCQGRVKTVGTKGTEWGASPPFAAIIINQGPRVRAYILSMRGGWKKGKEARPRQQYFKSKLGVFVWVWISWNLTRGTRTTGLTYFP